VITCLDPRVDPAHFLGLGLGDAIVIRNVGGRVTPEVINDVAFIAQLAENVLPDGPLFEVAVIHHTQCGTGALADDTFRHRYAQRIGAKESTLLEHAVLDPAATVTHDVERLHSAPAISPRVTFSGHVYDVVTGQVQTVLPGAKPRVGVRRQRRMRWVLQRLGLAGGPSPERGTCMMGGTREGWKALSAAVSPSRWRLPWTDCSATRGSASPVVPVGSATDQESSMPSR
jgi:carbonic anhydrase